jgi:hypothetical protein
MLSFGSVGVFFKWEHHASTWHRRCCKGLSKGRNGFRMASRKKKSFAMFCMLCKALLVCSLKKTGCRGLTKNTQRWKDKSKGQKIKGPYEYPIFGIYFYVWCANGNMSDIFVRDIFQRVAFASFCNVLVFLCFYIGFVCGRSLKSPSTKLLIFIFLNDELAQWNHFMDQMLVLVLGTVPWKTHLLTTWFF